MSQGPGRLFRRYLATFTILVSGTVLASALVQGYFAYQEHRVALLRLQQEQAAAAGAQISRFLADTANQLRWALPPAGIASTATLERRRSDYQRLLRQAPAVTEVGYLDATGRELLRLSRLSMNVERSGLDDSHQAWFLAAKSGGVYFGPAYYRNDSEPHITVAVGEIGPAAGVAVAQVNLKFAWDVVYPIRIGQAGHADVSRLPQVQAAGAGPARPGRLGNAMTGRDLRGEEVLSAHQGIDPPGWYVFVDQPLAEAFAPLYGSLLRAAVLVLLSVGLSIVASFLLAGRMVAPIRALANGVARIGTGSLDPRIEVRTGDELELLAEAFNGMAERLRRFTEDLQHSRGRLITAREEERRRLRRDLHDGLGPMLGSLSLKLDVACDLLAADPAAARALLRDLKAQTQTAIADIRQLVYALRPPALDDLGLVAALRVEADRYESGSLRITVAAPDRLPPLPAAVEVAAYRIAQEALTNVVRHAGARACTIRLAVDTGALQLEVVDDGRGFPANVRTGVGLTSMRERALELGGACVVAQRAEGGTYVRASLPLLAGMSPDGADNGIGSTAARTSAEA